MQFLGIQYATLDDRLAVPQMRMEYGSEGIDATQLGPRVVSPDGCEFELNTIIQQTLDLPTSFPMSELEGLHLNITVPSPQSQKKLPVLVFIHGGGFMTGANAWPQYDFTRLVKLSAETSNPVIGIGINYRLWVSGNLTSQELRNAGYPGNNSLRDQQTALKWIKTYILGFGGDPNNVTVFGESAGAISTVSHLYSTEPLFKRCISVSGTPLMLAPLPASATDIGYDMVIKSLGLDLVSAAERITKLLTIPAEELIAKVPQTVPMMPFTDGNIIPGPPTFEIVSSASEHNDLPTPGRKWCESLMIGDCQFDGQIFSLMLLSHRKKDIAKAFCTSINNSFSSEPSVAQAIFQSYNIEPATPDEPAMMSIIQFGTDINYFAPAVAYAEGWPGTAYYYQFNEPNPWDGPFKGYATHALDVAYLFQNFNEKLTAEQQAVAKAFAEDVVRFANGEAPWKAFTKKEGGTRVYGPSSIQTAAIVQDKGVGKTRKDTVYSLAEKVGLDGLGAAWVAFIQGR